MKKILIALLTNGKRPYPAVCLLLVGAMILTGCPNDTTSHSDNIDTIVDIPIVYIVTFDRNFDDPADGTEADPMTMEITAPAITVENLPQAPAREGYVYTGWNTEPDGTGAVFTVNTALTADITVYAQWRKKTSKTIVVTNSNVSGNGSLPKAVTDVVTDGIIIIAGNVGTIKLNSRLEIKRNLIIEGNGAIITRNEGWTAANDDSQLLYIAATATVRINGIHFKGGKATDYGAAIRNAGNLSLESCIFSGNRTTRSDAWGGAVYSFDKTLNLQGCTFYENTSGDKGGAVFNAKGTLILTGNLFYGNIAKIRPAVSIEYGKVVSGGYNAVNLPLGTGTNEAGWTAAAGDTTLVALGISGDPCDADTFVPTSALRTVMSSSAIEYFPATDFQGEARTWPGAPGAVN